MPVNEGQIGMIPGGAYGAPATTDPEVNQGTHAFIGGGGAATFPITLDDGTTTYSITASLGTLTIEVLNDSSLVNSEITLTDTTFLVNGSPKVTSVVAGTNVTVDNTDPLNPIVSSSGGGGGLPALANDKLWVGNGSNVATAVTFTGDVTVANTGVTSLKATGPGASGPFGSATTVPVVTIDANGRVTAFTTATIALPGSAITSGTVGISFLPTGTGTSNVPVGGVIAAAGPVGDAAHTPVLTYNAAGQLTTVTSTAIAIPESAVTNLTTDLAAKAFHLVRRAVITAATYTAVAQDLVPVDTTSNSVTVTLPNAPANATFVGVRQIIRGGTNTVTVVCAGSDVFSRASGPTSSVLTLAGQEQIYQYDTATAIWTPVSDCYPLSQLLASPAFTGVPTAPTGTAGDNTTQLATDAFVMTAINNAIAAANPAVAVQAATAAILPNSPTYSNGVAGVGATLTTVTTNTALVVDGVTPTLNQRILVKNQASAFQNGVYVLSTIASLGVAWILTRALDYDQPSDINNTGAMPVVAGTVNTNTSWLLTSTVATIGTDALTYTQFSLNPNVALPVANGGTGLATLTAHGVLLGEGTGNVSAVAPNATSTFALFSTGASTDPAYRAIAESDVVNLTTDLSTKATKSWYNVLDYGANAASVVQLAAVTTTVAGNLFTFAAHGLSNADSVVLTSITTTTGIVINTTYYVISATTNTFQLSTTVGGASVTLATGNGTVNATAAFAAALTSNNTAFTNAWAAATAAKGMLYIPTGIYSIGPGILTTSTNDAGILGENQPNTVLYLVDTTNTGICVYQRITNAAAWTPVGGLIATGVPEISGFVIDGTFSGTGSIGLKVGCGNHCYREITARYFYGTGGSNGVTGLTGAIGILIQNTIDSNSVTHEYEESCFGPRTRIVGCQNGLVMDKSNGHQSFGYATFPFLFTKNCQNHIIITNGAWLYATQLNWAGCNTGTQTTPAVIQVINSSRIAGALNFRFESDAASSFPTFITLDSTSVWKTFGVIDVMSFAAIIPVNSIVLGVFHHEGPCAISAIPAPSDGWHDHGAFSTPAQTGGASNTASTFTVPGDFTARYKQGVAVRWQESGAFKYGVVSAPSTYGSSVTTVTLAPNTDYWMVANPDLGSFLYSNDNPSDFPGWFNYTPTFTGYSAAPTNLVYKFRVDGTSCTYFGHDGTSGTSNAATLTATLPITVASLVNLAIETACAATDNGVALTSSALAVVSTGGTTVSFGKDLSNTGGFTTSGGKRIRGFEFVYPI